MSRIGKKPIPVPGGVDVKLDGDVLTVKGPKGILSRKMSPEVRVEITDGIIHILSEGKTRQSGAMHGLFRVLVDNMVTGVSRGFEKKLEIVGVGYRAELKDRSIIFNLGYSHPIEFGLPEGIDARIEKTRITLNGIDKDLLGMTAARIRGLRAPEPYKGKGIKYGDETIRRKAGKAGAS